MLGKLINRSSHRRCSIRKGFLRNFTKFTGKHLRQCHFLNKVADLRPATLFTKETLAQVFSCEFLRAPFLQKTSGQLLLYEALTSKFISAILGFHTFTGCDITGNFYGKSKLSCWNHRARSILSNWQKQIFTSRFYFC